MTASHIDQEKRSKVTKKEWSKERTKIKYTEIGTVLFKQPSGKKESEKRRKREEKERWGEKEMRISQERNLSNNDLQGGKIWQVLW